MDDANPIERLTARELEILRMVSLHLTSKEIARRLGLSPATVDRHVANILQKLDTPGRLAAVRLLLENAVPDGAEGHAENLPTQSSRMAVGDPDAQVPVRPGHSGRSGGRGSPWFKGHGLISVVSRAIVDGALVITFVAVLAICVFAIHWIILQCEAAHVDHGVILILKALHYVLVCIDAVGLIFATALLTFRFVKTLKEAQ